jgi:hypothetical protein
MSSDLIDLSIYKNNNYSPNLRVLKQATGTGVMTEAPGLVDLIYSIAATPDGPPIDPALTGPATERVDASSIYYRLFPGAVHTPILFPTYQGKDVYLRLFNVTNSVNIAIRVAVRKIKYG